MKQLRFLFFVIFITVTVSSIAQVQVHPELLDQNKELTIQVGEHLDSLLIRIKEKRPYDMYLVEQRADFTLSTLKWVVSLATKEERDQQIELLDLVPISKDSYKLTLSMMSANEDGKPELDFLLDLIVIQDIDGMKFTSVIDHRVRYWNVNVIDGITYYYRDRMNEQRAELFGKKHRLIAANLSSEPKPLTVFLCDNYKEALDLMGYRYDKESIGKYKNGHGVDASLIFSIMGNEDFSHDVLHCYVSKKVERKERNWVTEEGLAYLWGNAYWTDSEGEMIELDRLLEELRAYVEMNPEVSLLELFEKDEKPFGNISEDISVRSTISGLILRVIEKEHGMDGIWQMLRAGREPNRLDPYLDNVEELMGISRRNFDRQTEQLLFE